MRRITASSLPRVALCPASAVLPWAQTLNPWAKAGQERHAFLHDVSKLGREKALEMVPLEYRETCERINVDKLPTHLESEVTFALSLVTGKARILGYNLGRDYSGATEDELVGTADVIGVRDIEGDDFSPPGVQVYLSDYKGAWAQIPRAIEHWQMRFLAVAATRVHGATSSRIELIKLGEDGEPANDAVEVDRDVLDSWFEDLRDMLKQVADAAETVAAGEIPMLTQGSHCNNCPAFRFCPAKHALLKAFIADPPKFAAGVIEGVRNDWVEKGYQPWKQAKKAMEELGETMKELARELGPIPTGEGKWFACVLQPSLEINVDVAQGLLLEHFGEPVAMKAVRREISATSIENAFKAVNGVKGAASDATNALEIIAVAGGSKKLPGTKTMEVGEKRLLRDREERGQTT